MCTAVSFNCGSHFFGRNLDVEGSYGEAVTVTPRNFTFSLKKAGELKTKYAIIGVAKVVDDYPLYFDATSEKGLSMAGLNFPGNAYYNSPIDGKDNITPFELVPYVLGKCQSVKEAKDVLEKINITDISFSSDLPLTPLHWMVSDKNESIVVEPVKDGLKIYENPVGVLTNNPPFDMQLFNLNNYMGLSANPPENNFSDKISLSAYSRGMGALGLPGDLSSSSRFVRAVFTKFNSVCKESEAVSQFFHILGSVCQQKGCTCLDKDVYEYTSYSSCCDTDRGLFYYTTYENSAVSCIDMGLENLDGDRLEIYPMIRGNNIFVQNKKTRQ